MLNTMRRHATGWMVKVLFFFLIVSFAVWGIGDVFRGQRSGGAVAEVAGASISQDDLLRAFDQRFRELQQQAGSQISRQDAMRFGIMQQALSGLIARHLVDAQASDLGLSVDTATVAAAIRSNPAFQGPTGFDRSRLDLYLRSAGLSEDGFVAAVRGDMVRERLVGALTQPVAAPEILARRLDAYRGQQRRGRIAVVGADKIDVGTATDQQLQADLDAHKQAYEAPEYRALTLVAFGADDLTGEIESDDATLRAEYERRQADFRVPAARRIEQLLAPDEATAKRAADLARSGQPFPAVAQSLKDAKVERSELDGVHQGDLPQALDKEVWSLAPGAIGDPVQTPFGWHVVKVLEARPAGVKPFAAVKGELASDMKQQKANGRLPGLAAQLDDEIAAGAGLEAAAQKLGLPVTRLDAVDAKGQNPAGEAVATDRLNPEILDEVFAAAQGETSLMKQTKDGRYYMFVVNGITPAHPRQLSEVRPKVTDAWRKEEQEKRAKAQAQELRERIATPSLLATVAGDAPNVQIRDIGPLKRDDQGYAAGLRPDAVKALFATEPGHVATNVVPALEGWAILAVDQVIPAPEPQAALAKVEDSLATSIKGDLLQAYEAALRERYTVSVNQTALAQLMGSQGQ